MNINKFNRQLIISLLLITGVISLFTSQYIYPLTVLGLALFIHQVATFTIKLGKRIPIREMIAILSLLQLVITPFLDYHIFPNLTFYGMSINEADYMNYAVPANLFLIIGLNVFKWPEKINYDKLFYNIKTQLRGDSKLGFSLLVTGFIAGLLLNFAPASLSFLFLLVSYFKYIGAIYLIFSDVQLSRFWFFIIYGSLIISSILAGMFIDLFIWGLFLLLIISFKFRLSLSKNITLLLLIFIFAFSVQAIKGGYRASIWRFEITNPIELFYSMLNEVIDKPTLLFEREVIDFQIARLNQGWIVAKIMNQVPAAVPYANGTTIIDAIKASILPRFASAEKSGAGNRYLFMHYTGHKLYGNTTMNLGLLGESYANFGIFFGAIFVGLFSLLLNFIIYKFENLSFKFPTLFLWLPFILTYPIRPGNDIAVLLNYLVKALIVMFVFFYFFRKKLKLKVEKVDNSHRLVLPRL